MTTHGEPGCIFEFYRIRIWSQPGSAKKGTFRPYNEPFVDGITPEALGSISIAIRNALPNALNTVSI